MYNWLTVALDSVKKFAQVPQPKGPAPKSPGAGQLAVVPVPKVSPGETALPSFFKTTQVVDAPLPQQDRRLASTDITGYRTGANTRAIIRDLAAASPDLSAALNAYLRTAITRGYKAVARNMDGTFSRDATSLLQQLLVRFDTVQDYTDGFSGISSMRSNSESLGKELMLYGSCCFELVLGKDRLPRSINPISVTSIKFKSDANQWLRPVQFVAGQQIDLDLPTIFYVAVDQDLTQAYSDSPLEPAIQPVLFAQEFMNDLRRIVKRVIHPRLSLTINEEKFRKNIPAEAVHDPAKLQAYMDSVIAAVTEKINGLNPEDALVMFDSIGVDILNNGNISLDKEYEVLKNIVDAKMATGSKALPSILGHGSGSQNIASSETLLFMKNAAGSVQEKLNEIYSRALTLAVRLFGQDVYVEFRYDNIDLRPDAELEAFKVMKQSRILEQLSWGFLLDDEAAIELTGQMTPAGFKPLSGTQFLVPVVADPGGNPHSGTSNGGAGKKDKPQTPGAAKGGQKK